MKIKIKYLIIIPLLVLSTIIIIIYQPLRNFHSIPVYKSESHYKQDKVTYNPGKKTVIIVAHTDGTELFDLMAPFYLFNSTEKANVYIVAEKKSKISLLKGLVTLPNFTFKELDSLRIQPDIIVLPAMIKVHDDPNSVTLRWLNNNYKCNTKILSICQGSLVAAASGIYDTKILTTHASLFEESISLFKKPIWVKNIAVTKQGNLYSTAGVSNAVEGSLTVINDVFGKETLKKVMNDIHYPNSSIKTKHSSIPVNTSNKFTIANKIIFKKNSKVGVLLQNGINEFSLAAILDTYTRTFPYTEETVLAEGTFVKSKYGLTLYPTSDKSNLQLDELHVLSPENFSTEDFKKFNAASIVNYNLSKNQYIFNTCLARISNQYNSQFKNITKVLLDYN